MNLTVTELRERLSYDPLTGQFTWLVSPNHYTPIGLIAGATSTSGHIQIKIHRRAYMAHRLAWLYMMGEWPKNQVDHINRIPGDNRWANLRAATHSQNARNRVGWAKSGHRGVYWQANSCKWQAQIRVNGRIKSLGYHIEKEAAIAARLAAEKLYFGEFSAANGGA